MQLRCTSIYSSYILGKHYSKALVSLTAPGATQLVKLGYYIANALPIVETSH
jgi:hypothetical protein